MQDKKMPDGKCEGRDLPDRGATTGVTDTYGAGKGSFDKGYTDNKGIRSSTQSDR